MSGAGSPRISNLPREEWTDEARHVFAYWGEPGAWENGSSKNLSMVLAQHPALANAYHTFGRHLLVDSKLPVRPRELVVLRSSWHLKAQYEWHYHVGYALTAGMSLEEVAAIRDGPESPVWDGKDADRAVLAAVDGLYRDSAIADETWAVLAQHFDRHQLMDLVFTVGNYTMLGWAISAFRMPIEDDVDVIGFDLMTQSGTIPGASRRPGEGDGRVLGGG